MTQLTRRLTKWLAVAGGTILVGLVLLTVADVCLRYLLNAPIFGGQDLAKMGLLTVVATAIAYGGATDAHIAVDFLGKASPKLTRWTDLLSKSISIVLLALLVWKSIDKGLDALQYGDNTIMLKIPFWPFYFILAIGFALYTLILLGEIGSLLKPADGIPADDRSTRTGSTSTEGAA